MQQSDTVSSQETPKDTIEVFNNSVSPAPAKALAEEKPVVSEASEKDESKDESLEAGGLDAESRDESEESEEKGKGAEKRIKNLLKQKTQAQRELEYWKAQALENLKAKNPAKQEDEAPKELPKQLADGEPDPDKFESHTAYLKAVVKWELKQEEAEKKAKEREVQVKSEFETRVSGFQNKVKEFQKVTEDFSDVMEDVDDIPMSIGIQEALLDSDLGPQVMYELAKNRTEYERINKLSVVAAAKEIGKLEARISSESQEKPKEETKKLTKAPPPLKPAASGTGKAKEWSIYDPDIPQAEYERLRRKQMKRY